MAIYTKTTKQMLVDLINEGNPNLPFPINDSDFDFTVPEVIPDPGNGHNTKLRVIAKPNTNYIGNIVVTYRRLNIGYIFRNMTLEVQRWIANTGSNGYVLLQLDDLLPLYSEKYGMPFTVGEWTNRSLTGSNGIGGATFPIAPVSTNLVFVGNVTAKWIIGERTLESLLPVDVVEGRLYPGGNDLDSPEHKYWVTPDSFNMDFTEYKDVLSHSYLNGYFLGYENPSVAPVQRQFITNVLPKVVPREHPLIDKTNYAAVANVASSVAHVSTQAEYGYKVAPLGLNGLQPTLYVLPHATVPEANSEFFNRVLVFTLPDDCPWGAGKLYFHFNV